MANYWYKKPFSRENSCVLNTGWVPGKLMCWGTSFPPALPGTFVRSGEGWRKHCWQPVMCYWTSCNMQSTFPQQSWVWWHIPDTSTLRRLRLGDCLDFKASLSYTVRLSQNTTINNDKESPDPNVANVRTENPCCIHSPSYCNHETVWPRKLLEQRVYLGHLAVEGEELITTTMGKHGSKQAWWLE